tara:strand:- start:99 stop:722 length:624 start_codon:yes stop_codon:yes gene_type:complete
MLISILIPSISERSEQFKKLQDGLYTQIKDNNLEKKVEIISIADNRTIPLIEKRNVLQKLSSGKYFTHLDDDDNFSDDYCVKCVNAIENLSEDCDIITYDQKCFVNDDIFIVTPNLMSDFNLNPDFQKYNLKTFERYPWQYHLFHKRFKEIYRTDSDSPDKINKPAMFDDLNWLRKIKLEYPQSVYHIDFIGHVYHFEKGIEGSSTQ